MKCNNCKNEINKDARFCTYCGQEVIQTYKNNNQKYLYIGLAILVVVAVGLASVLFLGKKIGKSYDDYIEEGKNYLLEQDYESAIDMFTKAYDFDNKNPEAYEFLFVTYEKMDDPDKADEIFQEAKTNLSQEDYDLFYNEVDVIAIEYRAQKETDITLPDFDMTPIAYKDQGYIVQVNKKFGVMDPSGNYIFPAEYEGLVLSTDSKGELIYGLIKKVNNGEEAKSINYYFGDSSYESFSIYGGGMLYEGIFLDDSETPYYKYSQSSSTGLTEKKEYDLSKASSSRYTNYFLYKDSDYESKKPYIMLQDQTLLSGYNETEIMTIYRRLSKFEEPGSFGFSSNLYGFSVNVTIKGLLYAHENGKFRIYDTTTNTSSEELYDAAEAISEYQMKVVKDDVTYILGRKLEVKFKSSNYEDITCPAGNNVFVKKDGKWIVVELGN